jgi:hypothetical protein
MINQCEVHVVLVFPVRDDVLLQHYLEEKIGRPNLQNQCPSPLSHHLYGRYN